MDHKFPLLTKALLDVMDELWPERSADLEDSFDLLMWKGGARSVVRKLHDEFNRQYPAP